MTCTSYEAERNHNRKSICHTSYLGHYQKHHNTPRLSPKTLHEHRFIFSPDHCKSQEQMKTMFMQNFGRKTKSILVFLKVAYWPGVLGLTRVRWTMVLYVLYRGFSHALYYTFTLDNYLDEWAISDVCKLLVMTHSFGTEDSSTCFGETSTNPVNRLWRNGPPSRFSEKL